MANSKEVLLTSENYIKSTTPLSDSLAGKYLLPTIKTIQDIELTNVLGRCLVEAIQDKVKDGTINHEDNLVYKDLLDDYVRPYLSYMVLSNLSDVLYTKIVNAGTVNVNDEHMNNAYREEKNDVKLYYLRLADSYKRIMQDFLLKNRKALPELTECECNRIKDNLHSAYSGGIWLGWSRGKMTPRSCKGC